VFKTSCGEDLKMALTELLGKPLRTQEQLVIIEVYGGRISRIIGSLSQPYN